MRDCDVVVIGAGFSGLRSALRLKAAGLDVRVLEARNRVGGRAKPITVAGVTVDAGGQWLGARHTELAALAAHYGVASRPQYAEGRRVMDLGGAVRTYRGLIPAMKLSEILETGWTLWRLNRMARSLPAEAPWTARQARDWDTRTLGDWKHAHVKRDAPRSVIDIATRAVLCVEPEEVSLLQFLAYVRASGSIEYLAETTNGAQAFLFDGGLHQLSTKMAAELGDRVALDCAIGRVRQQDGTVLVEGGRETWRARRVVIAVSPAMLERIEFEPRLPEARRSLHAGSRMGSVIKCHIAYAKPFWREQGFTGEAISDTADFGPVFDGSPRDAHVGILTGFMDGEPARRFHGRPVAERRARVVECLVRFFGPDAANPIDYADQDWREEEWSGGCYTAIMAPGLMTTAGAALRAPFGLVHWAATETATVATGYFEGALNAGDRAAREVVAGLGYPIAPQASP